MGKNKYIIIHFTDGEILEIRADWIRQDDDGFFDFMKKIPKTEVMDNEEDMFVATVQCSNVKYIIVDYREE